MTDTRPLHCPDVPAPEVFDDAAAAVVRLCALYDAATAFLTDRFQHVLRTGQSDVSYRAYYPEIRLITTTFAPTDSRLSFGHVPQPGTYSTTVTCPDLFRH